MPDIERNGLEKIILAGIGAITKTAETAAELLDELVKKGELTVEQGKAINEELKYNIKEGFNDKVQSVQTSAVNRFVDNMDQLTPEEIEKIRAKMDDMENAKGEEE